MYVVTMDNQLLKKSTHECVREISVVEPGWLIDCKEENWDGHKPLSTGMYQTIVDGVTFHFCLKINGSNNNNFYISLTGGRYGNSRINGPRYSRWKYAEHTDSSMICIDDPMIYHYGVSFGWFSGGKDIPLWETTAKLILAICKSCGVDRPNLTFFGSSAGGTASILVSHAIGFPCSVVAINSQINIHSTATFKKLLENNAINSHLVDDEYYIANIIANSKENTYLIMTNLASIGDYENHYQYFCEKNKIIPKFGIHRYDNVITWVYYATSVKPHSAVDWISFFPIIEFLINSAKDNIPISDNLLWSFNRIISEHHKFESDIFVIQNKGNTSLIDEAIVLASAGDFGFLDTLIDNGLNFKILKKSGISGLIHDYPEQGFHVGCTLMHNGYLCSNEKMALDIAPVVLKKVEDPDIKKKTESRRAIQSFINNKKTKKANLKIMAELMRNPELKNSNFILNSLFDILWKFDSPESMKEMIELSERFSSKSTNNCNAGGYLRVSRMYLYGKGHTKNLDKAEEYAAMALNLGNHKANRILNKIKMEKKPH